MIHFGSPPGVEPEAPQPTYNLIHFGSSSPEPEEKK